MNPLSFGPSFTADQPGTYVVQLIVNDGTVDSAPATVTITTTNSQPVANAGPDQLSVARGSMITLDGTLSSDADGHVLTYRWALLFKPEGSSAILSGISAANPTFVADAQGEYVAQLIVNDGFVDSAPDTVLIRTANERPIANAGPDQAVLVGATVTLDGTGSTDPEGSPLTFRWTLTERPIGSAATMANPLAPQPQFVADRPGSYIAELIVGDGALESLPDTVVITATAMNEPPVAGDDHYEIAQDGVLDVSSPGVLGNDTDPNANPLTAVLVTGPAQASSFTLNADGNITQDSGSIISVNGLPIAQTLPLGRVSAVILIRRRCGPVGGRRSRGSAGAESPGRHLCRCWWSPGSRRRCHGPAPACGRA